MSWFIFLVTSMTLPLLGIFDYDHAVASAQREDWSTACSTMTALLVDQPDNAQLLYDTGVASYKKGDIDQADAYFKRVTELSHSSKALKEQAYFNRGNTFVKKKELYKALDQYKKVLELNPDNEQARSNYERVKQMLERQEQNQERSDNKEQQEQSKNNQSKNGSEGQESQSGAGSSDQKDKENHAPEDQDEDQDKNSDNRSREQNQDNKNQTSDEQNSNQQDEQKQRDEQRTEQSEQDKNGQENGLPEEEHTSDYDAQWSKDNQSHNDPDNKHQDDSFNRGGQDEHGSSFDQQQVGAQDTSDNQDKNKEPDEQEDGYQAGPQATEKLESWAIQLLQDREKQDGKLNKKMIKATVSEQLLGSDEKNCW